MLTVIYHILLDCNATLYGPIINGEESTNHIEVLMGNETSPIELICQVAISNSNRYPTIALVIPEIINSFEELRGGVRNDDLYQDINYTRPDSHPQTNSDIMRYSFQIYPKIKMNRTMLRCGVTLLQRNGEICWGEQVVLIKYVNSSLVSSNTGECLLVYYACNI